MTLVVATPVKSINTETKRVTHVSSGYFHNFDLTPYFLSADVSGQSNASFLQPRNFLLNALSFNCSLNNKSQIFTSGCGLFTQGHRGCRISIEGIDEVFYVNELQQDNVKQTVDLRAESYMRQVKDELIDTSAIKSGEDFTMNDVFDALKFLVPTYKAFTGLTFGVNKEKINVSFGNLLLQYLFLEQRILVSVNGRLEERDLFPSGGLYTTNTTLTEADFYEEVLEETEQAFVNIWELRKTLDDIGDEDAFVRGDAINEANILTHGAKFERIDVPNVEFVVAEDKIEQNVLPNTRYPRGKVSLSMTSENAKGFAIGSAYAFAKLPLLEGSWVVVGKAINVFKEITVLNLLSQVH